MKYFCDETFRDTTVLPNIHGIASIIPVLFAPIAEYRYVSLSHFPLNSVFIFSELCNEDF